MAPDLSADASSTAAAQPTSEAASDPVLAREAVSAVAAMALERSWLVEQLQAVGAAEAQAAGDGASRDAATQLAAEQWWQQVCAQPAATRPKWLKNVLDLAETHPDQAVTSLRQAWQSEGPIPGKQT